MFDAAPNLDELSAIHKTFRLGRSLCQLQHLLQQELRAEPIAPLTSLANTEFTALQVLDQQFFISVDAQGNITSLASGVNKVPLHPPAQYVTPFKNAIYALFEH